MRKYPTANPELTTLKLKLTPEEHAFAERCAVTMSRDEIASCNAEAIQRAIDALREDVVRTMTEVIVRHVRAVRSENARQHAASKKRRKSRTRDHNE
jgi:hypothetical protein